MISRGVVLYWAASIFFPSPSTILLMKDADQKPLLDRPSYVT